MIFNRAAFSQAKMVTLLFSSFLLIVTLAIFVYFKQTKFRDDDSGHLLPPAPPRSAGLFAEREKLLLLEDERALIESARQELLQRANEGDHRVLLDAADNAELSSDTLYCNLLERLINSVGTPQELFRLVSYVARDERLRVTPPLAMKFLESWRESPDRVTVAEVLHVSALSDDPLLYHQACEAAAEYLLAGRLPNVKAEDLQALIEGEYWILSGTARSSGAGFVLKRSIAEFRKQLVTRSRT